MTREEIIAKHDERHLQNALRRVKALSDRLVKESTRVQVKYPKSTAVSDIVTKVSTVSAAIAEAVESKEPN